jgi:type I restriction enzyme, S subunit
MRSVALSDLCDIRSGGTPSRSNASFYGGNIPWAKISDIEASNGYLDSTEESITEAGLKAIRGRLFPEGTLLFAIYGSIGKMAFASRSISTNQAILGIKIEDQKQVDARYLFRWLESRKDYLTADGLGIAQKNLSAGYLRSLEIPLPPLEEQKRIAAILDQADSLRRLRQRAIDRLNTLGQAIFYEMFGDPGRNPMGWEESKFGAVGSLARGISKHRPRNDPVLLGGKYPLIQTGDVANADGYIRDFQVTYSDIGLRQSRIWSKGTLCITIAANIGKTAILDIDACFPDSVVGFTASDTTTTEYVQYWLSFIQEKLEKEAPQSAQKNINLAILSELNIPLPPRDLQKKFSDLVREIDAQKRILQQHLDLLTVAFSSLQHRAFRGGL